MSYKVGDKVLIHGEISETNYSHHFPYKVKLINDAALILSENELSKITKTYEDGLTDAWELARKVALYDFKEGGYTVSELKAIFDKCSLQGVFRSYTIQQALAKIEAYEGSKKIKVGDVVYADDEPDSFGVVTWKYNNGVYVMWDDGSCGDEADIDELHKTGRTVDIEHLLEQIRGD